LLKKYRNDLGEIVEEYYLQSLSLSQIARSRGISAEWARQKLTKGLAVMRTYPLIGILREAYYS
jgi:predicted DNA-binding protein YlxM (UPF0122 family)